MLFRSEGLAFAETVDNGKPITVSKTVDIPRSALNFEFFAEAITQFASESHQAEPGVVNYTLRQPLGVVGCISPWNLPLYLLSWKIAPALAAGNTVVAKPSEVTPLTAHHLAKICAEIGFPKGVLNIVHGRGATAGAALCAHPKVKAVTLVAMPDDTFGEKACAFVVPKPGEAPSLAEIVAFLKERQIASFKLPERLELVSE